MKRIHRNSIIGERSVNLVGRIALEMGCLWYPTGGVEAGIDGTIELRDAAMGEATNLIVQVQSKATDGPFTAETDTTFEYLCGERDLDYWSGGNAPVILVVSRPATNEAYWVAIKDYFRDPAVRKSRKVRDRFDAGCKAALFGLAVPRDSGLYFAPMPRRETLWWNLLPVASFGERLYVADTDYRRPGDIWAWFRERGEDPGNEWLLKDKRLVSFHDLGEEPWRRICDPGTREDFDTGEWAHTDDPDRQREFVWLLNQTVRQKVWPDLRYHRDGECLYVSAPDDDDLSERVFAYRSLVNGSGRTVFKGYPDKRRPGRIAYYRHAAFAWRFLRFDDAWFLEITPTYHYTLDGHQPHPNPGDLLKGVKQLEHNQHVLGQVLMWADYLTRPADLLTPAYPFLAFDPLRTLTLDAGVDDARWLGQEERRSEERARRERETAALYSGTLFDR